MTTNELIEQIGGRDRLEQYAFDKRICNINEEIRLMASALLAVLDAQAATHECNDSPFKKVEVVWLGKCRCGNKVHTASTIKGGCDRLYDDDEVTCNACGRRGVIQCCEGYAGVLWETELERTTPPVASAPDVNFDPAKSGAEATIVTHFVAPEGYKLVPIEPSKEM